MGRGKMQVILIALAFVVVGLALARDEKPRPATQPAADTRETIDEKLDRVLPEIKFDGVPFIDVVGFLRDVSGANIDVDWDALSSAGVEKTAPVSANLKNVRFRAALREILHNVASGRTTAILDYEFDDGIIVISTREDLSENKNAVTRIYDVRSSLLDLPGKASSVVLPTRIDPAPAAVGTRDDRVESLTKLLTGMVAPDSWQDAGGAVGSLRERDGLLIITQTPANHREIESLLNQLKSEELRQYTVRVHLVTMTPIEMDKLAPPTRGGPRRVDLATAGIANASQRVSEVTCFANQQITIASGAAKTVITHVSTQTPADSTGKSADADSAPTTQPVQQRDADSQLMQDGFCLDLLAQYVTDAEVKLDISAVEGKWTVSDDTSPPAPGDPDRIQATVDHLHTTARLPLNQAVVLASLPLGRPDAQGRTVCDYLIAEVSMSPQVKQHGTPLKDGLAAKR